MIQLRPGRGLARAQITMAVTLVTL
jgi:hypothetical protein